ncbi:MAG TPA: response regulator [Clostridia bacterium]|nr:response regulator [Clostridia bacterium]
MPNPGHILIADDDEDFVLLLRTAFECVGISSELKVVGDGAGAISYLKGEDQYSNRNCFPLPELLLLDLRLPRVSGANVLSWVRRRPEFDKLSVVILTGAELEGEGERLVQMGANEHLVKPMDFTRLVEMVEHLVNSWVRRRDLLPARLKP